MENLFVEDSDPPKPRPKGEELPIEEVDEVDEDYNAIAQERIKARDEEALKERLSLSKVLAGYSMGALNSTYAVLSRTKQDLKLRNAIAAEIERRVDLEEQLSEGQND